MQPDKYSKIRVANIANEFFQPGKDEDFCIFMISCLSKDKFIHLDPNFHDLTGYPNELFIKDGMDFWFALICPQDMEAVTAKIIEAHKALFSPGNDPEHSEPLTMEYRFRHADGSWVWLRDTRYLVSYNEDKVIDKVLVRFELLSPTEAELHELTELLGKEKSCTRMLEHALVHQQARNKQPLAGATPANPAFVNDLTKREREILQLIGQGLSTKLIAGHCSISIHTVETHRRHLLEKLNVKNSMELIKEASKVFWL